MTPFSGIEYIAIAIANHQGLDKQSWEDRINWVKTNKDNLENLVPDDPKTKYLYIKAVKALRDVEAGKKVNYIMDLDATNSGVQVLAILGKCKASAATCNVINTGKREDLYGQILQYLGHTDITRQEVKDAIIPMLYGSKKAPEDLFGVGSDNLKAFYEAVYQAIPVLGEVSGLLKECWDVSATEHSFVMPDGHEVILRNKVLHTKRIKIEELNKTLIYQYEEPTATPNSTSILANVVHATDAYISREMVRRANKQGFQLAHIHDSFWTSPKYFNLVRTNYIDILKEIAKSNLLEDIMEQLTGEKVELEYDNPDLWKEIVYSEYALS